jgi:hypothetical protein
VVAPLRLLLQAAERRQVALLREAPFGVIESDSAKELVLQVVDAREEARGRGIRSRIDHARRSQRTRHDGRFGDVADPGHRHAGVADGQGAQHPSDALRATRGDDADAGEVGAAASGHGLDRDPVAHPLDEHDAAEVGDRLERVERRVRDESGGGTVRIALEGVPGEFAPPLAHHLTWAEMTLITAVSARVVVSPTSRPSATSRSRRRMILPDRVFGSSPTM